MDKVFSPARLKAIPFDETPESPLQGYMKIYPKDDGNFYKLDSAGNEVLLGSGGGGAQTEISLIPNPITLLSYDAEGRITRKVEDLGEGNSFEARFSYHSGGGVTEGKVSISEVKDSRIANPEGWVSILYNYDGAGRLTSTTHSNIVAWAIAI